MVPIPIVGEKVEGEVKEDMKESHKVEIDILGDWEGLMEVQGQR